MTEESAERLLDGLERDGAGNISPEAFAKLVREYLDTKGSKHRIVFMVDEVGQYIGNDPDLMLNLQTVVEDLGTHCGGRAWVLVTSQEDMDKITRGQIKGDDFSKIQGHFKTRISLSSANTDEVIRLRLLEKTEAGQAALEAYWNDQSTTIKNSIRFRDVTAHLEAYKGAQHFAASYPFAPYQFKLLQEVFTKVRTTGSSGTHLASGERSMLDAFQLAAHELDDCSIGSLAPFHLFYQAIQNFLATGISRVIGNAEENPRLRELGDLPVQLLETLFMLKHLDEKLPTNVDNLVTLHLERVGQDRQQLKERIQKALELLGKLQAEISRTEQQAREAASAREKSQAEKRLKQLQAQLEEAQQYHDELQTRADEHIELDLDDGVAYNYSLFQGLVYEGSDLKMDQLLKASQWKRDLLAEAEAASS